MTEATWKLELVEGWTNPIIFSLLDDGETPSGSLAGSTVEFFMSDLNGNPVDFTGDCSIEDAAAWQVRLSPDATDFVAGNYYGRFKVTDTLSKIAFFPQEREGVRITVRPFVPGSVTP